MNTFEYDGSLTAVSGNRNRNWHRNRNWNRHQNWNRNLKGNRNWNQNWNRNLDLQLFFGAMSQPFLDNF